MAFEIKEEEPKAGAPAWMCTFADLMSLLLTFFIMLASMANYDDVNERFMAAIESINPQLVDDFEPMLDEGEEEDPNG